MMKCPFKIDKVEFDTRLCFWKDPALFASCVLFIFFVYPKLIEAPR